jgi:hypothetical protein
MAPRWQYVDLEAPTPLGSRARIRLPGIDMQMVTGRRRVRLVEDIEAQARKLAEELAAAPLPHRADEYGEQLCRHFHLDERAPARDWVDRWLTVGWAVGTVEETDGSAHQGKSERHHLAALNVLRAQMAGEVEETDDDDIRAGADAYFLALFGGYYLRRAPEATAATILRP